MQPYFAPYLGYISLLKHSDEFILFDTVQFIRHGWIERNRILKQNEGWLYIQVPLEKYHRETLIKDVKISNETEWKKKILSQLVIYKKVAPNYYKVINLLNEVFEKEYTSIVQLNKALLEKICMYLGFSKILPIFSEMNLEIDEAKMPDEWALNICKKLGENIVYINPIGGLDFFDKEKYTVNNIQIFFQKMILEPYDQKRNNFETGLSIIDVMMFNNVEEINVMLDNFVLV
ncbi:MAG: WbqC family protein [Bacteroidetes bacterium]|nr:WbqC family protein [Bacteroidota bacterium]